ncbi:MAG: glycosyl transferase [Oscillospiraceae bacterium]|jgi:hypothetical protein|nr:glycosyl transferase [Oscillospiraceae bacterium]
MIPKKIHYCWFGGKPLPKSAQKCINSWARLMPDYEIIQWNESNFDTAMIPYIKDAYAAKNYAYVSDFARFYILYEQGGVYFDTDVELLRSLEGILAKGGFMACELDGGTPSGIAVAPGLGIASEPHSPIYKEIMDLYGGLSFLAPDGSLNNMAVVGNTTNTLKQHGLKDIKGIQEVEGITVYPAEYFNPLEDSTGILRKTANTYAIHWYSKTWIEPKRRLRSRITRVVRRIFGKNCFDFIKK